MVWVTWFTEPPRGEGSAHWSCPLTCSKLPSFLPGPERLGGQQRSSLGLKDPDLSSRR